MRRLILEDESLDWERGALNVQPTLDRKSQPYSQSSNRVSLKSPVFDQQEFAYHSSWSDTDPYPRLSVDESFDY